MLQCPYIDHHNGHRRHHLHRLLHHNRHRGSSDGHRSGPSLPKASNVGFLRFKHHTTSQSKYPHSMVETVATSADVRSGPVEPWVVVPNLSKVKESRSILKSGRVQWLEHAEVCVKSIVVNFTIFKSIWSVVLVASSP